MADMRRIDETKENEERPSALLLRQEGYVKLPWYAYRPTIAYTIHEWIRKADGARAVEYVPRQLGRVAYIARDEASQQWVHDRIGLSLRPPLPEWMWQRDAPVPT